MDFARTMARLPDEELLRIANPASADDYAAEALSAACAELEKRGVTAEENPSVMEEIEVERAAFSERENEPLSNSGWLGFLLFGWMLVVTVPAIILLFSQGYRRKAKEAIFTSFSSLVVIWALFGAALIVGLILGF